MSDNETTPPSDPVFTTGALASGPSWQEQDLVLRDLWVQKKTPTEIAGLLGRSVAAIMTRAARLGLPRRSAPGRKPGSRCFPKESAVERKTLQRARAVREGDVVPAPSVRICLMCLRPFQSQGRHHRICPSCKTSAEYASAVALSDINFPV